MGRRKRYTVGIALLVVIICAATVYGISETGFVNEFQSGGIKVELVQNDEGGRGFSGAEDITAGQKISMMPEVICRAEPCYVRLSLDIKMKDDVRIPISSDCVYGMDEEVWVVKEDCFYLKEPLENGESVEAWQGIEIPKEWTEADSSDFSISINVDAVQSANIYPDYEEQYPWGSVQITQSDIEDGYTVNTAKPDGDKDINVVYEGGSKALEIDTENFFGSFGWIMPGDTYTDSFEMKNNGNRKIRIYFRTTFNDTDLLSKMNLKIDTDGKAFYSGSLAGDNLTEYSLIAEIEPGEEKSTVFTLSMPEGMDNPYQRMQDSVTWYLMVEEESIFTPVTSDPYVFTGMLVIMVTSVFTGITVVFLRRKKTVEER